MQQHSVSEHSKPWWPDGWQLTTRGRPYNDVIISIFHCNQLSNNNMDFDDSDMMSQEPQLWLVTMGIPNTPFLWK